MIDGHERSVRVVICADCGGFVEFNISSHAPNALEHGRFKSTLGAIDTLIIYLPTNRGLEPYAGGCRCLDRLGDLW